MKKTIVAFLAAGLLASSLFAQDRGKLGIGYDEGLAGKYYFTEKIGAEASLGYEYLGGYSGTPNNGGTVNSETNVSFGAAFLFNLFKSQYAYLDLLGQIAVAHDGTRFPDGIGDRNWGFLRIGVAPEIMPVPFIGFGFKLGLEIVSMGSTKTYDANHYAVDAADGTTNLRFFGPRNPFNGASLGVALFVYPAGLIK
jgi:hypothetical protein